MTVQVTSSLPVTRGLRETEFSRILLIKPSALGDVVHTIPVLVKLRRRYPDARIDWLITPENAEIVRCHPALSNVVPFARRELRCTPAGLQRMFGLLHRIRCGRYEMVLDLQGQMRSALFTLVSAAPVRIGFDKPVKRSPTTSELHQLRNVPRHGWAGAREGSWIAYSHRIPIPTLDVHAIDRYLWVGEMLGFDRESPDQTLHLPSSAEGELRELLLHPQVGTRPLAVVVPGSMWETKQWGPDRFAVVCRHLVTEGFAVVIAGSGKEKRLCQQISALCPQALDASGRTSCAGLAALIRKAALCVTNDSGSMHLAVATGTPTVSIFGPTNPVHIGPYGRPGAVVRADLPCSPCNYRRLAQCSHEHACMRDVDAKTVIARLGEMLRGSPV